MAEDEFEDLVGRPTRNSATAPPPLPPPPPMDVTTASSALLSPIAMARL